MGLFASKLEWRLDAHFTEQNEPYPAQKSFSEDQTGAGDSTAGLQTSQVSQNSYNSPASQPENSLPLRLLSLTQSSYERPLESQKTEFFGDRIDSILTSCKRDSETVVLLE